ncbi:hypothetical protein [Halopseudomonas sp.]|uniref:hypothetical protein n=1 Tax=Halopseudomonas sp. TaxID=2901191 RepID=UPI003120198B
MLLQQNIPASRLAAQAMIDAAREAFERGEKPEPAPAQNPAKPEFIKTGEGLGISMAAAVAEKTAKNRAARAKLAEKIRPFAGELSANQMAEKFGCSRGMIVKAASEHKIDIKVGSGRRAGPSSEQLSELRRCAAEGGTTADAAKWLGVPHGTAKHWALKHEIRFGVR